MHKLGVIDDEGLLRSYKDLGYDEEHATGMVKFTLQYNLGAEKEITRAEIITGYKDKLVDKQDALALLQQTGYAQDHAEYLLLLEDYKESKELQDMAIDAIKIRFQNNKIESFTARARLGELNLSSLKVEALIVKWELGRTVDTAVFSKTDLEKLYLNEIISEDQWRNQMRLLGFGWQNITWAWELMTLEKPE